MHLSGCWWQTHGQKVQLPKCLKLLFDVVLELNWLKVLEKLFSGHMGGNLAQ